MGQDRKSSYNQRQYALMLSNLAEFEDGRRQLGSLIGNLEGLLCALEGANAGWINSTQSEINQMELVWAAALDKVERGELHDADVTIERPQSRAMVDDAVRRLRALISEQYDPELNDNG